MSEIEEKIIRYADRHGKEYELTVGYANALIDTRRGVLIAKADEDSRGETDEATVILRRFVYPDCIAPVKKQTGFDHWPISFDEFCEIEPGLLKTWSDAVYEVNPSWNLAPLTKEEQEKKA
jgi:hypothetical protein